MQDGRCWNCNTVYTPTGKNQKYCDICRPIKRQELKNKHTRLWYHRVKHTAEYKEQARKNQRVFYKNHPDKKLEKSAKQYQKIKSDPIRYAAYLKIRRDYYRSKVSLTPTNL